MPDETANSKQPGQKVTILTGLASLIREEEQAIAGSDPAADVSPTDSPTHWWLAHLWIIALIEPHVSRLARIHVIHKQIGSGLARLTKLSSHPPGSRPLPQPSLAPPAGTLRGLRCELP